MQYTDLAADLVEQYPGGYSLDEIADLEISRDIVESTGDDWGDGY